MPDRFLDLTSGAAMIVTDLHGDREAFHRYISRFSTHLEAGEAQRLILLGDLIHSYGPAHSDASVLMVQETMALQAELGADRVIMVLGNHELPHLYGMPLSKGEIEFTPRFEHALGDHRQAVLAFFDGLPLAIRTAAGVLLTHAGPALNVAGQVDVLRHYDHQAVRQQGDRLVAEAGDVAVMLRRYQLAYGKPYDDDAAHYLAVTGPQDPRYLDLLRSDLIARHCGPFRVLWNALLTQNEVGLTEMVYVQGCRALLAEYSSGAPAEQRVMVSGHLVTPPGGHMLVNRMHLRLSSAAHARPREAGNYLLLDCARPVRSANDLLSGIGSVFNLKS